MEGSVEITIKMSDRHVIISTLPEEVAPYRDKQNNDPGSCLGCPLHTSVPPPAHTGNHTDGVCTVSVILLYKTTDLSRTLPPNSVVERKNESVDSYYQSFTPRGGGYHGTLQPTADWMTR